MAHEYAQSPFWKTTVHFEQKKRHFLKKNLKYKQAQKRLLEDYNIKDANK